MKKKPAGAGRTRASSRPRTPSYRRPARWIGPPDLKGAGRGWPVRRALQRTGGRARNHCFFDAERRALRHGFVHVGERVDADFQHDGRAQFRPCQLLHARRLFRVRDRPAHRVLACLLCRAGSRRRGRRACRAFRTAARAQIRTRAGIAVHLRPRLRHRRSRADDLGQAARRLSRPAVARFHRFPATSTRLIPPTKCSCCSSRSVCSWRF